MSNEMPITALVAEDDRALADILRTALVRVGAEVTVAHDGQKALNFARTKKFDFIISDYQMPKLNGMQFLRSVREDSLCSHSHLILCSAKAYEFDSEELMRELKLSRVFYKPFSLAEVSQAVLELKGQLYSKWCADSESIDPRPVIANVL